MVYNTEKKDEQLWAFRQVVLEADRAAVRPGEEDKNPPISAPNSEGVTLARLRRLADLVSARLPHPNSTWTVVVKQLHERLGSSLIPLGSLSCGLPRHRAILYKYCCDLLQLPCQLCRWPRTTGAASSHIWNVAFDGIRSWVVNFRSGTPFFLPSNSSEAVEYTTPFEAGSTPDETRDDLHLWLSKWKSGEERTIKHIGSGAFGAVESVEITVAGMRPRIIARKTLKPGKVSIIRAIWLEAQALLFLEHPNIMRFYCASIDFENCKAIFYTELCDGSLSDVLKRSDLRHHLTIGRWSQLLLGLLGALAYMHSHSFVHRDIKPGNILLKFATHRSDLYISSLKLADFGLARNFRYTKLNSLAGTPGWRPPEVVAKTTQRMPEKSDIYGFGLLLALCLIDQGTSPWGSLRMKKPDGSLVVRPDADVIPFTFVMEQLQTGILSTLPPPYIQFIQACLHPDWASRLTAVNAVARLQLLIVSNPALFTSSLSSSRSESSSTKSQ